MVPLTLHTAGHINKRLQGKCALLLFGFHAILVAIAAHLILGAAARNTPAQYQEVLTYCDNTGVLNHGSKTERELKEKQAQFDVLYITEGLVSDSLVKTVFTCVEGHLVEKKVLSNCSHPEITNDLVDRLADVAL